MVCMAETNYLKCSCKECGNHIEFPASAAGTTLACPHCGQWTELSRPQEPAPGKSRKLGLVVIIGCVIAAAALAGWYFRFGANSANETATVPAEAKTSTNPVANVPAAPTNPPQTVVTQAVVESPAPPKPKSHADLKVGKIKFEKTSGNSLVYAVGTVTNDSTYQRFGVKIELDLFNGEGVKIGGTQDYKDILEPRKKWSFHALIPDKRAATAKVAALTEED